MRSEHLKRWLETARKADKDATTTARAETMDNRGTTAGQPETEPTEADNREMVVDLVQAAFQEGNLTDYRGIGVVELMWKVVAEILNLRLTASITFHNFLHGFWAGSGTGTTTVEAKLLQQLAALREEVLCVILLDLHKVYDALDRSR